jgi:hypothetical protein
MSSVPGTSLSLARNVAWIFYEDVNLLPKLRRLDSVSHDTCKAARSSCPGVWRGVPAALDILFLAASMNSMVRHDDGASLKSTVTEFAHPALLARRLAAFRDHFFDVFHKSQISSFFLPPADCAALREPAAGGIAQHAELKKKSRTSIRV